MDCNKSQIRSKLNEGMQSSESKVNKSIGVHLSNIENSNSEYEDYSLRASKKKVLKPSCENQSEVDVPILSNEESDVGNITWRQKPTDNSIDKAHKN